MFTPGTVLLHDSLDPHGENLWFTAPREVLVAHDAQEIRAALHALEAANAQGLHVAGYLAYEAGFAFEERLEHLMPKGALLLWFGIYDAPERLTAQEVDRRLAELAGSATGQAVDILPRWSKPEYERVFDTVKSLIAAGDTYQVNLTFKAGFRLEGGPVALYRQLVRKQAVAYGALINTGEQWILSRSPELFVSSRDGRLAARPMKGTLKRGQTQAEDEARKAQLAGDEKNRAENLMIVDLLRNDLGRIAEIGSVKVTDLFTVETYSTLHTMTSGITARRRSGVTTTELLENLFPCGSITGAPKLRSMEIIHQVETGPRGIYTGSIGHFAPNGDVTLNVAIRTAVVDMHGNGEIGIGGGVVADSVAQDEYREALLKMAFFTEPAEPVTLIETLLWERDAGYALLDRHLDRLAASAAYFALPFDRAEILALLESQHFADSPMRIRLTLEDDGPALTAVPLPPNPEVFRFSIAAEKLDSQSLWLRHKTINRAFYDAPRLAAHAATGVDEVLFLNERGELTEGSITNLFIERDGRLLTPDLSSGLLPGTLRAELIASGRAEATILRLDDLEQAEAIWLGNSVRGLMRAEWIK
ncbi:MAG: aminodeoxychorismate synthase component I [Candidatus Devosia phytovorans]|uniref:Probable branched-chain-amino-acid aminotransferase n=1 Tax=Candidatus Devosia phytovorans TaxID=3121372 RepID=A0AAJ5VUH1_9HYPH|nr:aminodeoxychorismate synthase component I [Devosia sp.]WEK04155.1 MAG: aminodeoxychorismate synthase component I [Devosia sp.]